MAKHSNGVTPVRKQYLDIKREHPDAIVFFRLGDFYETFDDDAEIAARELDIVLTSRNIAKGQRIPMAGIPHHAAENYIARLIDKGYHVAICEQIGSEPVRGLVPRKVVRVVTPGTVVEAALLESNRNNYLAAVVFDGERAGFAFVDVTTGDFSATHFDSADAHQDVRNEIERLAPAEILLPESTPPQFQVNGTNATELPDWRFEESGARETLQRHFEVVTLAGFGLEKRPLAIRAAGAILRYVEETKPAALEMLTGVSTYSLNEFMVLDGNTRRNLELAQTMREGRLKGSLLGVLDQTVTPMGGRLLRRWVSQPLLDPVSINARLDGVEKLHTDGLFCASLQEHLKAFSDLERLVNRVLGGTATPSDLDAIRVSLEQTPKVVDTIREQLVEGNEKEAKLHSIAEALNPCAAETTMLASALAAAPPANMEKPGVIQPGWSSELDGVMEASREAREWIAGLEPAERKRTGIKSLKVGYNKVFGYYIEVTKANATRVPSDYIRKQTLVNAERYITPDLKEYETLVLNAEEEIVSVEKRIFAELCAQLASKSKKMLKTARAIAELDVLASLAKTAAQNQFVRPQVVDEDVLEVNNGRHPVVERMLPGGDRFVPNDVVFGPEERVRVLTGPNMSGKSTYLRQAAIIVLMAQIGSFIPADSARIGIVDRIFTRIGAQDEIHAGQSTFMVEMVEAANIMNHATPRSLLILDEIGRGTSTYDGLSLAWAMIEFIHNHPRLQAKTLFATHYHELVDLADLLPGVENYNVAVSEEGENVVFLHVIEQGGADRSYGIHVARLAGLPKPVVKRAEEILERLEASSGNASASDDDAGKQLALFPTKNVFLDELQSLDISTMSPLEALNKLYEWQQKLGNPS